jgi:hypothetical protein
MTQDEIIEITKRSGLGMLLEVGGMDKCLEHFAKLVAAKAIEQRTWVGLTDEEIDSYFEDHGWSPSEYYYPAIKAIEAKLKEKNFV